MSERTKRIRGEDSEVIASADALSDILSTYITTHKSAEMAILHLMNKFSFSPTTLQQILLDKGLDISFSRVKYREIAPFVGLDSTRRLFRMKTFELHRSRIPTDLFKAIVGDIDLMLMQYGSLPQHSTEEVTSRFLSPIFDRLVAEFGFAYRNLRESLIKGRIYERGRIEYYLMAFGAVSVIVMEVKLKTGSDKDRMDAIAQVIAECDACDFNNSTENFSVPVFGILWDGSYFHFFKFEGTSKPFSFLRGAFPDDPINFRFGIKLPDLTTPEDSALPFMRTLRLISEIIFDMFLLGYISNIVAFRERFVVRSTEDENELAKWDDALTSANQALHHFRDAESKRYSGDKTGANHAVSHGQTLLKSSLDAIPLVDPRDFLLLPCWDNDDIELA